LRRLRLPFARGQKNAAEQHKKRDFERAGAAGSFNSKKIDKKAKIRLTVGREFGIIIEPLEKRRTLKKQYSTKK
jgi:hypothetical protein